jgi:hypothetical protein
MLYILQEPGQQSIIRVSEFCEIHENDEKCIQDFSQLLKRREWLEALRRDEK